MTDSKMRKLVTNWISMASKQDISSVLLKDLKDNKISPDSLLITTCKTTVPMQNKVEAVEDDYLAVCLEYPYSMEEAHHIFDNKGFVSAVVRLTLDEILTETGESIGEMLISKMVDGNIGELLDDMETELAGCDANSLYFHVCCNTDPYLSEEDKEEERKKDGL